MRADSIEVGLLHRGRHRRRRVLKQPVDWFVSETRVNDRARRASRARRRAIRTLVVLVGTAAVSACGGDTKAGGDAQTLTSSQRAELVKKLREDVPEFGRLPEQAEVVRARELPLMRLFAGENAQGSPTKEWLVVELVGKFHSIGRTPNLRPLSGGALYLWYEPDGIELGEFRLEPAPVDLAKFGEVEVLEL